MTWYRVDDSLAFHHKVVGVGNAAMGLWVRAGAWCAQQLTDGVVPAQMVKSLGGTTAHARALVAHGLWDETESGAYLFHDWELYQPTSAEVRAERLARTEKKAKAGRAGGIASGVSRRANKEAAPEANAKQNEAAGEANANENEAPALPVPTPPSEPPSARKHPIAEDWQPSAADLEWAKAHAPLVNVERETLRFRNHFLDKGEKRPGWSRSWQNWLAKEQDHAERRPLRMVAGDRAMTLEQQRRRL